MANSKDNYNHISSYIGFDETYGDVVDIITGFKGVLYNNPPRVTGWNGVGKAMSFNGINQAILMNSKIIPNSDKTIIAYLKCEYGLTNDTTSQPNGFQAFLSSVYDTSNQAGVLYGVRNGCIGVSSVISSPQEFNYDIQGNIRIDDNKWHKVSIVEDNTNKKLSIYIDNVLDITFEFTRASGSVHTLNTSIGARYNGSGTIFSRYFKGEIDQLEMYDKAISPIPDKYLVFHDNQYKYHNGTDWQICTDSDEDFIQYGYENLSSITESQWNELVGDKSLKMWTDYEHKQFAKATLIKESFTIKELLDTNPKVVYYNTHDTPTDKILQLNAQPKPQLVKSKNDILIAGVKSLDKIIINGTGDIKTTISFDSGVTEYIYRNGGWIQVTDAHSGMTIGELTSLTNEELSVLRDKSNFIRFNYSLTGDAELTSVQMYITLEDTISLADSSVYALSYNQATKTITYKINKVGKYFVNYVT